MKMPKKVRFSLIWLSFLALWVSLLVLTEWRLFPCQTFIFDSDQGYYNDTCPLRDDRDVWVFQNDTSGFSGIPTTLTWVIGLPLILGVPTILTILVSLLIHKFRKP